MANQFKLKSEEVKRLIDLYKSDVSRFDQELERLELSMEETKKQREEAKARVHYFMTIPLFDDDIVEAKYDKTWPLFKKAEFVIGRAHMCLNTRSIAELIRLHEYSQPSVKEMTDMISNLSATLKQKVDKGQVFARVESGTDIYYGFIAWYDEGLGSFNPNYTYSALKFQHVVNKYLNIKKEPKDEE